MSRMNELSRLINNQASEIHERVIKKIMELMKVDEQVARDYKAALWRQVKAKNPDMKSNLDLSVEMEKIALKKNLKDVDLSQAAKFRPESKQKKSEHVAQKKAKLPATDELSATSQNIVQYDSSLSDTSFE